MKPFTDEETLELFEIIVDCIEIYYPEQSSKDLLLADDIFKTVETYLLAREKDNENT